MPKSPASRRLAALLVCAPIASACQPVPPGIAHVRVVARDYAFGAPRTVPAGQTAFQLVNEGTVRHEVQLYRFRPGISGDSALHMIATNEIPDDAIDAGGGVLIIGPADSARQQLLLTLQPGEVYGLECAFRDGPDKPQHRDMGMYGVVTVE